MHKLFYAPGACSLSPHIALREAEVPFELDRVDFMRDKKTSSGVPLVSVDPKGCVPTLVLPSGEVLTEGIAMIEYIADLRPEKRLAPPQNTFARVRLLEWIAFIATEIHKGMTPLYSPHASDAYKAATTKRVLARLGILAKGLENKPFLMGEEFTVADGYAFYALRSWQKFVKGDLPAVLASYFSKIGERPAVRASLEAEGLRRR